MPEYYLDIETTGLDPKKDQIIALAYMRLGMVTGREEGKLTILKAWELSEREILEMFLPMFRGRGPFSFVAIGINIPFIYSFLVERARIQGLEAPDPLALVGSKPYLDLKPLLVMMNKGSFKGASLENFTSITIPSEHIPKLFYERRFTEISGHIEEKAKQFHSLYLHLKEVAPTLMMRRLEDFKVKKE